jgi:hypothetical protein
MGDVRNGVAVQTWRELQLFYIRVVGLLDWRGRFLAEEAPEKAFARFLEEYGAQNEEVLRDEHPPPHRDD